MKLILENWRKYLIEGMPQSRVVQTRDELVDLIRSSPHQTISIDGPKGSTKKFGGDVPLELPFDYGEYPMLTNPADGMGWDIILLPMSHKSDINLLPVGHVSYKGDHLDKVGNDKIILAKNGIVSDESKVFINEFFETLEQFDVVVWY